MMKVEVNAMRKKMLVFMCICMMFVLIIGCSKSETNGETTQKNKIVTNDTSDTNDEETISESESEITEEVVQIADPVLEKMIREQIEKPEGDITTSDMEMVYSISINYEEEPVNDISGLEYAVNLRDFSFSRGTLKSLDPVAKLQSIFYLNVSYADITDPIIEFDTPALERIGFIDTNVSDFDFLKNVVTANDVSFTGCNITDLTFMQNWDALIDANLSSNSITDIEPLRNKIDIINLNLHQNSVVVIDALSTLTNLETLNISYNHVADITPIMNLMNLTELTAYEELDQKIIDRGLLESLSTRGVMVDYHK